MTATIPNRKARVLVVDDEPATIRDVYQAIAQDCQVLQATSVDRAIALTATVVPDLVMVDIRLGQDSGYRLAAALRQSQDTQAVPFVFMAEAGDDRSRGIELGALGFLSKPLEKARVQQVVATALKRGAPEPVQKATLVIRPDAVARMATVAEVDIAQGLKNVAGSTDLYLSVLRSLVTNHAAIAADLCKALEDGDRATATLLAHTSKTLCRTIGAAVLGELAYTIEAHLKTDAADLPDAGDFRIRYENLMEKTRSAISAGT